eukprot:3594866-Rhodomonas_salina.3
MHLKTKLSRGNRGLKWLLVPAAQFCAWHDGKHTYGHHYRASHPTKHQKLPRSSQAWTVRWGWFEGGSELQKAGIWAAVTVPLEVSYNLTLILSFCGSECHSDLQTLSIPGIRKCVGRLYDCVESGSVANRNRSGLRSRVPLISAGCSELELASDSWGKQ